MSEVSELGLKNFINLTQEVSNLHLTPIIQIYHTLGFLVYSTVGLSLLLTGHSINYQIKDGLNAILNFKKSGRG